MWETVTDNFKFEIYEKGTNTTIEMSDSILGLNIRSGSIEVLKLIN